MKMKYSQVVAAFIASGTAFSSGTALAWTNPVELAAKNGTLGFKMADHEFAWLGPFLSLGALIACIPSGFLVDAIGRSKVLNLLVIPFSLGWLFIGLATDVWMLYVGRFLLGIAFGAVSIAVPLYIGEIAQKEIRGLLGSFVEFQIMFGVFVVFLLGAFVKSIVLTISCAIFPLLVALGMIIVPESPNFLLSKGKHEAAAKSIKWLQRHDDFYQPGGGGGGVELQVLNKSDVDTSTHAVAKKSPSFLNALKSRVCLKALFINCNLMAVEQLSGINPITFYSTAIFAAAKNELEPRYSTLVIGVVQLMATLIAVLLVDKLGRRFLLLVSATLMAASLTALGFYFHFNDVNSTMVSNLNWFPVFALCVYVVAFALGFGPIPWIMLGELFPADIKGPASSIVITIMWSMSFVADKAAIMSKNCVGFSLTFWLFAGSCIYGFIFVWLFVPETKGKSLNEIQEMLSKKKINADADRPLNNANVVE